jgi:hypothetical protein
LKLYSTDGFLTTHAADCQVCCLRQNKTPLTIRQEV